MRETVRDPHAAGSFYPARADELRDAVAACLASNGAAARRARLALLPHAALRHSGRVAGAGHAWLDHPPLVVVIAPRHHDVGSALALPRAGAWRTPLGDVRVASDVAEAVGRRGRAFADDWRAHAKDHGVEAQLPFLQVAAERRGTATPSIVALAVGTRDLASLVAAGRGVAEGLRDAGRGTIEDALLLVSADLAHEVPADEAAEQDDALLELIVACEPEALHELVTSRGIATCALGPAVVGLAAARELGGGTGEVVARGSSAEASGDRDRVVSYAAVLLG